MTDRHTVGRALELVAASDDGAYGILLAHGTMELGYYKPDGVRSSRTPGTSCTLCRRARATS